jgi:hypothetical protein
MILIVLLIKKDFTKEDVKAVSDVKGKIIV